MMGWRQDIISSDFDNLVERNTPQLLATLLQRECREHLDTMDRDRHELAQVKAVLSDAQRIGLAVLRAQRAGRKTVRIADVTAVTA